MKEQGLRKLEVTIGGRLYATTVRYDGVHPGDCRAIKTTLFLKCSAIRDGKEDVREQITQHDWDGHVYWG